MQNKILELTEEFAGVIYSLQDMPDTDTADLETNFSNIKTDFENGCCGANEALECFQEILESAQAELNKVWLDVQPIESWIGEPNALGGY